MQAFPSALQPSRGLLSWACAGAIALGVHAVWWLSLPPFPAPHPTRVSDAPKVAYLAVPDPAEDPDALREDVRALWSPLLFALPSTLGFSASLLDERIAFGPPARVATPPPYLASRREGLSVTTWPGEQDTLDALSRKAVVALPLRATATPAFGPHTLATSVVLHIMWTDASGKSQYVSADVGRVDPWLDTKPWQAGATMEIGADGSVRHVFLEEPTGLKDRNAVLVRELFTLQFDPGGERTCRVSVRCDGTAPAGGGDAR